MQEIGSGIGISSPSASAHGVGIRSMTECVPLDDPHYPPHDDYSDFLASKRPVVLATGLDAMPALHPGMKPHQRDCVEFGLRQGRWGLFLDTGLGKTLCELEWSKHAAVDLFDTLDNVGIGDAA